MLYPLAILAAADRDLDARNAELERFTCVVSHDLQSPLAGHDAGVSACLAVNERRRWGAGCPREELCG